MTRSWTRRSVLRGMGAAVALPWLDAFAPRRRSAERPVRMAFLFMPNGVLPEAWAPVDHGPDYTLSPTLEPLAPVKDRVLVLTGLSNRCAFEGEGHYVKTTSLLSGAKVHRTGGKDLRCGISVDQLAARERGHLTPLPSIELGTEPTRTDVDMGYSTVYGGTISWRDADLPATKEIAPRAVFERLFRTTRLADPRDRSVLDLVQDDARALRGQLGAGDRHKLDEYFDAVRALERRIDGFDQARVANARAAIGDRDAPVDPPDFATHVALMLEMIELAFRTDTTRIATFMYGNAVSGRDFSFVDGVDGRHHELSHHENDPNKKAQYQAINRWFVQSYAGFVARLAAIEDGDGTLLDRCALFFGSGLGNGNTHDPQNLPILLAGGANGALYGGARLAFRSGTPLTNLYVTLLDAFGCPVTSFADSSGGLDSIRAS